MRISVSLYCAGGVQRASLIPRPRPAFCQGESPIDISHPRPGCGIVANRTMRMMSCASLISVFLCQAVLQLLLLLAGDVEQNPGPPKILKQGGPTTFTSTPERFSPPPPPNYVTKLSFLSEREPGNEAKTLMRFVSGVEGSRS